VKAKLNIFLVLYNDAVHVTRLVKSLQNQSCQDFNVWALDNCSPDNSAQFLKDLLPSANVIRSEVNLGYAGGNNLLHSETVKLSSTEYVCILNTDIELQDNFIEYCINFMDYNEDVSGLAPLVYYGKDNQRTEEMQCFGLKVNFQRATATLDIVNEVPEAERVVDGLPGCSFVFRTSDIPDNRLFPTENFMYGEELDLAFRCHLHNLKLVVSPKTSVWHYHNWSPKNSKGLIFQYYYMMRNRILFFRRYEKILNAVIFVIKECILFPLRFRWLNRLSKSDLVKAYYRGIWDGIAGKNGKVL
jgi:GT2 family glycosyltransferase